MKDTAQELTYLLSNQGDLAMQRKQEAAQKVGMEVVKEVVKEVEEAAIPKDTMSS